MSLPAIREFKLSPSGSRSGVVCDDGGAFVGGIPLLSRAKNRDGNVIWRPREAHEISGALSKRYGLPIDASSKVNALSAIAKALNVGDTARAQLITLHMEIPDPPSHASLVRTARDHVVKLANALAAANLLKADWSSDEHPRWPAGAPDSQGGEFAPKGEDTSETQDSDISSASFASQNSGVASEDADASEVSAAASPNSKNGLFDPVVYRGQFHDVVVQSLADYLRAKGLKVETEVPIEMADGSGGTRIDILAKGKLIFGVEVKTGDNPSFTPAQLYVYPHLMMGGSVLSYNPRIANVGLPPGVPLPPIPIMLAYSRDANSEPTFRFLDFKKMLQEFYRRFGQGRLKKMANAPFTDRRND